MEVGWEGWDPAIQGDPWLGPRVCQMSDYSPPTRRFSEARAEQARNASQRGHSGLNQGPRDTVFRELEGIKPGFQVARTPLGP